MFMLAGIQLGDTQEALGTYIYYPGLQKQIFHEPLTFVDFANYKCDSSQEMVQAVERMAVRSRWHSLASHSALCSHPPLPNSQ